MAEINRQGGDPTRVVGRRVFGGFLETIIDWIVIAALASVLGLGVSRSPTLVPVPGETSEAEAQLALLGLVYLGYFAVTKVVTLTLWGWTPGMLCVGVRCVRWDGRPPGILLAFWRSLVFSVISLLCGGIGLLAVAIVMASTKAHRAVQDLVAGTYVVDNQWFGHMILIRGDKVHAGPMSVRREEAEKLLKAEGIDQPLGARLPPNAKNGNPFLDKQLDTYVVWNARQERFLAFDKASGSWEPLD